MRGIGKVNRLLVATHSLINEMTSMANRNNPGVSGITMTGSSQSQFTGINCT